jgi:DNA-binding transcriptional ArsR family regulator
MAGARPLDPITEATGPMAKPQPRPRVQARPRRAAEPRPPRPEADGGGPAHRWTFLTNHAHVLVLLHEHPAIVLREVALRVGITERAVQRIVADLEDGGYIAREKVGRSNRYRVLVRLPLRHPIEAHRTIGDLLDLVAGGGP